MTFPWRRIAAGAGALAAYIGVSVFIVAEIRSDWRLLAYAAQVSVVLLLGTLLVRQLAVLRRTQAALTAANTNLRDTQASLGTSNNALRFTKEELKRARQQLIDGIEGLTDGLALYDADDRLVVCNSRYGELFGLRAELLRPGTPFQDILRAHVDAGRVAAAIGREDEWIAERLAQHRDPHGFFERLIDGHWYRFSDRPTSAGGTVTIFAQIDELKQREQRLHENQAILQSILDHIPVGVGIADRERRIVLLNKRLEALYGVELADVRGRSVGDVRPSRYNQDSAADDHVRVIQTGEPILGREDHYPHEAGEESWITSVVPIKDEHGAVQYVLRTTMEVPQLAKANRELADYRAFLIEAERQAKMASWYQQIGRDDGLVWSENAQDVLGVPPERLRRDADFVALIHPDDRERMACLFREITGRPASYETEYRIVRPDGSTAWIRGIAKVQRDSAGNPCRLVGAVQDITRQKRTEEALRESEARLKDAQRRARLAYWVWDPETQRYTMSEDSSELLGVPWQNLRTSADFHPHYHAEDRERVSAAYRRQRETLEPTTLEFRWRRPDGKVIWLRDVSEQERDEAGRVQRLFGSIQDVSEQKRIEEILRDNQAVLLAAQRRARIAYWLSDVDSDGTYISSDLMAEVLGLPLDAVPIDDADCLKLVHPEDRARVAHAYERAMTGRTAYAIEYRMFRGDGSIGWVRELSEIQNDAAGRPARMIGTIQDITDQKSTEEALRASEARMRAFMDHAPIGMFVKDLDGRFIMLNRQDAQFFGRQPEDLIGRRSADFLTSDDAAIVEAHDRSVVAAGTPVERELHFASRPQIEWSYEVKFPIRDAGGAVLAIGGVAVNISALKRAEQALRDSEARLRGFLDHAPFAMYLKDTDLRYQLVNRAVEQFQGMTSAEICGKTPAEIYPPSLAERFIAEDHEVLARGTPVTFEYSDPAMSSYVDSLTVRFPIRDSGGRIVAIGGITQDVSERKQAERALRDSEARMRAFMDNAPAAIAMKDTDRRFVMLNSWVESAYGRQAPDLIGRRSVEILPSEGTRTLDAMESEVVASGKTVMREVYFPERKELPWTYEVKFPVRNGAGEITGIGGIAIDISDRKRAEAERQRTEMLLQSFLDNAPMAMAVKDVERRFVMLNAPAVAPYGRSAADVVGKRTIDIAQSDGAKSIDAMEREVTATGRTVTREVHFADRSVSPWTYEVKFPIKDGAGGLMAIGGIALDITDRKRTELALRDSEARLRRAQEQARLAYWTWQFATDRTAEEFHWSLGSGPLLGIADEAMPKDVIGYDELVHPDDLDRVRRLYADVRQSLDRYDADYRVIHPGGKIVWVREIGEAVRDAKGRRVGVEGTLQDITEQRALEEKLVQSQKMEAIGQLTGGIAHDFNNLLAVILGNLELLGEEFPDHAAARQKIDAALRSTLRGSDLTHRLLAYARRQPLAPRVTQVNELIRNMRDLVLRPLGPTIDVTFALGEKLWPTEIDQAQLETSLLNLVINARDAMPDGGRLVIETGNVTVGPDDARHDGILAPGDYVSITVGDSGTGMSETVKARAFDPFFTTKGVGKGTGLGLSMVYGFVKQSGGHVEIDSAVGSGTTIRILLPRAKNSAMAAAAA
jgi:two-component system, cell cycle sensor histidine kinase and response regulator CckA